MLSLFKYKPGFVRCKVMRLFMLLLLSQTISYAQVLKSISLQNGSPTHRIQRLVQHTLGYLLVGTQSGLYRFNSAALTRLNPDTAIASTNVTAIGILKDGEVWIGFQNGQLGKLVSRKVALLQFEEGQFKVPVTDILQDAEGRVWCATGGEGIYCYQNKKWYNLNTDDGLSDNYVYDLLLTKRNQLLAATDAGVNQVQFTGQQKRISFLSSGRGLSDNITTCLSELPDGRILAGHEQNGYSLLQSNSNGLQLTLSNRQWPFGRVNALQVTPPYIYAVSADSGLVFAPIADSLAFAPVPGMAACNQAALADQEGNLWAAAPGEMMVTRYPQQRLLVKAAMANDNAVHAVLADRHGNVWFGNHNQLYMVSSENGKLKKLADLPTSAMQTEITALHQDEAGIIWIGTMGHGIWLLQPETQMIKALNELAAAAENNVLSISGKGNVVWV
ncbi:MAG TPA: two-component regulator propeller domain-containing protein, partial [Phnomibacter sp.]|nr:two-component regulator propeller domain-containing protein [Phnomibacter sp.]